jgi:hypothetical protein
MSLNSADQAWFASFQSLPPYLQGEVATATAAACHSLQRAGLRPAEDDRVKALQAAVTRFVVESAAAV